MSACPGCGYVLDGHPASCPDCHFPFESEDDLAFASRLRQRVDEWPTPPSDMRIDPRTASHQVVAWLDVCTPGSGSEPRSALMTIGAHFTGHLVCCDRLHNQLLHLPAVPTVLRFEATGAPAELGDAVGDWMASIVDLPYEREEWHRGHQVFATRWVVRDPYLALGGHGKRPRTSPPTTVTSVDVSF